MNASDDIPENLPAKRIIWKPFPKQEEFLQAVFSWQYDFILYGGAIRGGKTIALLGTLLLLCKMFPGSRWAIVRKTKTVILQNLIPSWEKMKPGPPFLNKGGWDNDRLIATFSNGSQILFFAEMFDTDKELNRFRGLEVNGFALEEINELQQVTLGKCHERAGSYVIPMQRRPDGTYYAPKQPKPIVIASCNPTFGWVKTAIHTPWKVGELPPNMLYIQSKITDNLPLLKEQPNYLPMLKRTLNKFQYMVFVEGNWDVQLKTGGEWLRSFEINDHVKAGISPDPNEIINISWDSNVLPYVAVTFWQVRLRQVDGKETYVLTQVGELPCKEPYNSPRPAASQIARYLRAIGYTLKRVRVFGDRSTKNRTNIDEQKRSFFQIMVETLLNEGYRVEDMMLKSAPSVSNICDFVNDILAMEPTVPGVMIEIAEECTESIGDYIITKTDLTGGILKIRKADVPGGPSYEHNGHLTDTLKDFVVALLNDRFIAFCNRNQQLKAHGVSTVSRQSKITP